jgi:signal transduction histidine kinase
MRLEEELSRAKQYAESASAAKSEFLTNISHDLRTPLHAILGFSQIMEERWEHLTAEQRIKYCQRIRVNARYQLDLINNILDLARAESGRLPVEMSDVDLRALIEEVVECFSGERHEDVRVRCNVPALTQPLRTDQGKLKQIITNLFSNAVKCTKRGEVVLRVVTRNEGVPVQIDVIDTGAGIPEGDLEKIFEPFNQMTLQGAKWEGSGLGLSICRSLCTLLGYRLVATSKPGSGSIFSILLESASQAEAVEPMAAD